jgi:hypothetical protein
VKVTLRLPPNQTFNGSLGDYTQWVHLACPHWFDFSIDLVRPVERETLKKTRQQLFSDHSRLPAVDYGLGDYTQWVHSACPHWSRFHSTWSAQTEWKNRQEIFCSKTPAESNIRRWPRGLHPVGALCVPPLVQRHTRRDLVDSSGKTTQQKLKHPVGVQIQDANWQ